MGDDERTPDDPELEETEETEETEEPAGDDEDDVEAHSRPLPPPRPMNGL